MKFYRLPDATFYDCKNNIYQFIKSFLDDKMSILRNIEHLTHLSALDSSICLSGPVQFQF